MGLEDPKRGILLEHDGRMVLATALAKQYEATLPFIENRVLDVWTHNKTIQKAVESYRITDEQKAYLKTLKL